MVLLLLDKLNITYSFTYFPTLICFFFVNPISDEKSNQRNHPEQQREKIKISKEEQTQAQTPELKTVLSLTRVALCPYSAVNIKHKTAK